MDEKNPPISSARVLDLASERGFLCGKILADLGCEVIKVEKPGGDPSRVGPYYHDIPEPEKSLYWFAHNLNKKDAIVRTGSISYFIDCIYNGIKGSIVSNGIIGSIKIVINGTGNSNKRKFMFFGHDVGTCK